MKILFRIMAAVAIILCSGFIVPRGGAPSGGASNPVFTPTALYYMAASGCSDSNNGLSSGSPWCTVHHAVNCGDVIEAAPGTYNGSFATWGVVSNCPSTTAGTTGSGGVMAAVLLCNGNHGSCKINCSTAACNAGTVGSGGSSGVSACMNIDQDYWAIEGWDCNGNAGTGTGKRGFQVSACLTTTTILHHIAFINDVAVNAAQGYDVDDCGYNSNVPGNGADYFVVAGSIAQNANRDPICLAAIDFVGPANSDTNSGTHTAFLGNFVIANTNNVSGGCTASDGEGMMLDTLDAHGYSGQIYISNNITYSSSWVGLQAFMQSFNSSSPNIYIANNTFFGNMQCAPFSSGSAGEINLQMNGGFPWAITTYNNVALTNVNSNGTMTHGASPACASNTTTHAYAMLTGLAKSGPTITTGGSGLQNIFKGQASSCDNSCDAGDNVIEFSSTLGTNTYENPSFANTSDLLTNWVGVPTCTAATTTACMGWNYSSQTATSLTPISDLTPSAAGTTGKGAQPPGACAADAKYPAWINYINVLEVISGTIYEVSGLTNKPCGV